MRGKYVFVIWFPIVATTLLVAILSLLSLTPVQSGPGGLTALANIPNYIIFCVCIAIGIAAYKFRPRPLFSSPIISILTIAIYFATIAALVASPLVGIYKISVTVVDWSGQPIPNVPVVLSVNRTFSSLLGVLSPSSSSDLRTDKDGKFTIRANSTQRVYCSVNAFPERLKPYRFAALVIEPQGNNKIGIQFAWSNKLFDSATNGHYYTKKNAAIPDELKVYLPIDGGDDANPYLK